MHVLFGCICVEYTNIDVYRTLDARLLNFLLQCRKILQFLIQTRSAQNRTLKRNFNVIREEEAQWATIIQAEHVDAIRKVIDQ